MSFLISEFVYSLNSSGAEDGVVVAGVFTMASGMGNLHTCCSRYVQSQKNTGGTYSSSRSIGVS